MTQAHSVTPLRQRMLDDMKLRNMTTGTRRSYVRSLAGFSAFHDRSLDELTLEDVRDYQLHLVARGLKASSICPIMSALRFFYGTTLGNRAVPLPRKADPLPAILSQGEVKRLLTAVPDRKMRTLLTTVYVAGLRVSEVVGLQVGDIDSTRMTIHVREGNAGGTATSCSHRSCWRSCGNIGVAPDRPPGCSPGRTRPARSRHARCSAPATRRSRPPASTSR